MDTVFRMIERYKDTDDKNRGIPVEKCLDLLS
jgi:pyridoxine kinase